MSEEPEKKCARQASPARVSPAEGSMSSGPSAEDVVFARRRWCQDKDWEGRVVELGPEDAVLADRLCAEWLVSLGREAQVGEGVMADLPFGLGPDATSRRLGLVLVATHAGRVRMEREMELVAAGEECGTDPHWAYWNVCASPDLVVGNFGDLCARLSAPGAVERFSEYLDRQPSCRDWRERYGRMYGPAGGPRWRHGLRCVLVFCLGAAYWSEYVCVPSRRELRALDLFEKVFTPGLLDVHVEPVHSKWHVLNCFAPWRVRRVPSSLSWWMYAEHVSVGQCKVTLSAPPELAATPA